MNKAAAWKRKPRKKFMGKSDLSSDQQVVGNFELLTNLCKYFHAIIFIRALKLIVTNNWVQKLKLPGSIVGINNLKAFIKCRIKMFAQLCKLCLLHKDLSSLNCESRLNWPCLQSAKVQPLGLCCRNFCSDKKVYWTPPPHNLACS